MPRHLLAMTIFLAAGSAAQGQTADRWAMACRQIDAGRECDMTVPLKVRSRASETPVVANFSIFNRPAGIDEVLLVRIDSQALPSHRLVGVSELDRKGMTAPGGAGEIAAPALREALAAGKDLMVMLIDDATGKQAMVKLPAAGFEAGRTALMGEVAKGANRK